MSDRQKPAPSMAEVSTLRKRFVGLERKADELGEQEQELTNQIAECHATGAGNLDKFTQQRREVKALRADVLEALPVIRERLAEDREAAARGEAEKRMTGISRAFGSLRQELDGDEAKAEKAAASYKVAADRVNARFRSLATLRAEAGALVDRFPGVAAATFTPVVIPAKREGCTSAAMTAQSVTFLDHAHVRPVTEKCEYGMRTRRTFEEIKNTPSFDIIKAAGPKPWPELTSTQHEIVDGRAREAEQEARESTRFADASDRAAPLRTDVIGPLPQKGARAAAG